jgi:hypothetical protein
MRDLRLSDYLHEMAVMAARRLRLQTEAASGGFPGQGAKFPCAVIWRWKPRLGRFAFTHNEIPSAYI